MRSFVLGLVRAVVWRLDLPNFRIIKGGMLAQTFVRGIRRIVWIAGPNTMMIGKSRCQAASCMIGIRAKAIDTFRSLSYLVLAVKDAHTAQALTVRGGDPQRAEEQIRQSGGKRCFELHDDGMTDRKNNAASWWEPPQRKVEPVSCESSDAVFLALWMFVWPSRFLLFSLFVRKVKWGEAKKSFLWLDVINKMLLVI